MCLLGGGVAGVQMSVEPRRGVSDPLELGFQALVSCLTWELGAELRSSRRAASTPIHRAISSALLFFLFLKENKTESSILWLIVYCSTHKFWRCLPYKTMCIPISSACSLPQWHKAAAQHLESWGRRSTYLSLARIIHGSSISRAVGRKVCWKFSFIVI